MGTGDGQPEDDLRDDQASAEHEVVHHHERTAHEAAQVQGECP